MADRKPAAGRKPAAAAPKPSASSRRRGPRAEAEDGLGSAAERAFLTVWRQLGGQDLEPQHQFDVTRRFKFDFARHGHGVLVAIEIDGGVQGRAVVCHNCGSRVKARLKGGGIGRELRLGGRHTRPEGFTRDCEKLNLAGRGGWTVFRFTPQMIEEDPIAHLLPVVMLIRAAESRAEARAESRVAAE